MNELDRTGAPFIVRIAGLPVEAMESFRDQVAADLLAQIQLLQEKLTDTRHRAATRIFDLLPDAPEDLRGLLLEVKRDCHNGRSLVRRQTNAQWPALRTLVTPLLDDVLQLEESIDRAKRDLEATYEATLQKERDALAHFAKDVSFLRGVTLSSVSLATNLTRFAPDKQDKRQARLESALLRYVSRAALKTSPFSTLTRVGLGVVAPLRDDPTELFLRFVGAPWDERSLVRAKSYVLEQDCAVLFRYPPLRDRLRVVLNGAHHQISENRYSIIRPGFWQPRDGAMTFVAPMSVEVKLSGAFIEWLFGIFANAAYEPTTFGELRMRAEMAFPASDGEMGIHQTLEKLVELGLLLLIAPWSSNTGHLDAHLLAELRSLPPDPRTEACCKALERLGSVQQGYASCAHPLEALQEMGQLVDALWEGSRRFLPNTQINRLKFPVSAFFEDVYLVGANNPDKPSPFRSVVELAPRAADELVRSGKTLAQWCQLFGHQRDFLLALAASVANESTGPVEVPFVELASKVKPLWKSYDRFTTEFWSLSQAKRRVACFNPLDLESVKLRAQRRQEILGEIDKRSQHVEDETLVSLEDLDAALSVVPLRERGSPDACLFLQCADGQGKRWMLNRLYEGTGRYGSRYTPNMPEDVRRKYCDHLAARAEVDDFWGKCELVDIAFSKSETLNVHATQTRTVLEVFDESLDAPLARKLSLGDLRVRFDGPNTLPRIVDREGKTIAPVHLGVADQKYLPFLVQFLLQFGPQQLASPRWPQTSFKQGAVDVWRRIVVGPLVVSRKAFTFLTSVLPAELRGTSKWNAFVALNNWRMAQGIPDRVFLIERVSDKVMKPQFIDFTSPHFAAIFTTSVMQYPDAHITLEEMLPGPEAAPIDGDGQRRIVELQLDTLAFRQASASSPTESSEVRT